MLSEIRMTETCSLLCLGHIASLAFHQTLQISATLGIVHPATQGLILCCFLLMLDSPVTTVDVAKLELERGLPSSLRWRKRRNAGMMGMTRFLCIPT